MLTVPRASSVPPVPSTLSDKKVTLSTIANAFAILVLVFCGLWVWQVSKTYSYGVTVTDYESYDISASPKLEYFPMY